MLKRYQILLNDWQAEHYKIACQKYDVSFSEMIRMALCVDILAATRAAFPGYKPKLEAKKLKDMMKKSKISGLMQREMFHKLLSDIYFEARKATEVWKKGFLKEK